MSAVFISDLHLQPERPDITRAFFHFLKTRVKTNDQLYILGDFFEVWIGDDHKTEFNQSVIRALQDTASLGTEIFIMHGNRDFLIGDAFCQEAKCTLLPDPTCIELNGERILLMHGDSLCTRDTEYMQFRQLTRNPAWQKQLLDKPIKERLAIARQIRGQSTESNRQKAEDIMDVTPNEAVRLMVEHKVQTLIHGHTHRPHTHNITINNRSAQRIVLGDWGPLGWMITQDETKIELAKFEL